MHLYDLVLKHLLRLTSTVSCTTYYFDKHLPTFLFCSFLLGIILEMILLSASCLYSMLKHHAEFFLHCNQMNHFFRTGKSGTTEGGR
jgi:hypothetical protein